MDKIWLFILIGSLAVLGYILLKNKVKISWIGYAIMNITIAAVLLYIMNLTGFMGEYRIPINAITVGVIGILGIPGIALLLAVKLIII